MSPFSFANPRIPQQAVLAAYSALRQPRAQMVWERSRRMGRIYDFHGPSGTTAEGIRKDVMDMYDPVWHHDMEDDLAGAVNTLRDRGVFAAGSAA